MFIETDVYLFTETNKKTNLSRSFNSIILKLIKYVIIETSCSMWYSWQGGLQVWPLWVQGLAPSWRQLVPASSNGCTTGHSWALQPSWWYLCENMFRKGQKCPVSREEWGKRKKKQNQNPQSSEIQQCKH